MWHQTKRLVATWLRVTLALTAAVAVALTVYGVGSPQLAVAVLVAVGLELLIVRRLCREWSWQARGAWWRFW